MKGTDIKTILYIQHAAELRGSCVSLLYTMQSLDYSRYRPVAAIIHPSSKIVDYYTEQGIETIVWPGINTLEHTTLSWTALHRPRTWSLALRTAVGWKESERRTLELVERVRPDLVHLNSAVLVPSARALYRKGIPFVWHVREGAIHGHFGLRYTGIRRAMLHWPPELIFLSKAERLGWVGGRRGRVIPNFVNFSRFNSLLDQQQARREFGIREDAKLVLYFGGFSVVKGIFPLLQALARVKMHEPGLICLMPGAVYESPLRWQVKLARTILPILGLGTHVQRVNKLIKSLGLETSCIQTSFVSHIEKLIAASDLVVFPALTNHFARPVVEAAAMGKPVVASRFPILEELVQHEETGLLVPPGEPVQLADAILALLRDPDKRVRFGERGREIARSKYDAVKNTHAMMQVYDELLTVKNTSLLHLLS